MRLLHTADWHLGKVLRGAPLLEDQAHVLEEFVRLARDARPDAILVAGDVYDRAVPPADAVTLLDGVLTRLVEECRAPIVLISGNHDSADRLGFASRMLRMSGIHIVARSGPDVAPVVLPTAMGSLEVHALPYAEPAVARAAFVDEAIHSHEAATRAQLAASLAHSSPAAGARVAMAHVFLSGGSECESERPLTIGGVASVPADVFAAFDYTALGHLHAPQSHAAGQIQYPGSLMRYAFSDAEGARGALLVEVGADRKPRSSMLPLPPKRSLRKLSGTLAEIACRRGHDASPEDYISVELADEGIVVDAMGRMRELYPNTLEVSFRPRGAESIRPARAEEVRSTPDRELFRRFVESSTGTPLTSAQEDLLAPILQQAFGGDPA